MTEGHTVDRFRRRWKGYWQTRGRVIGDGYRHDPFAHPPVTAIFPEYLRPKSLQLDLYPSFRSTRVSIRAGPLLSVLPIAPHVVYRENRTREIKHLKLNATYAFSETQSCR